MIQDVVIELRGDVSLGRKEGSLILNLARYQRNQLVSKVKRNLTVMPRGVADSKDDDATADSIGNEIAKLKGAGDVFGAVCVAGYSHGSIVALCLGVKLKSLEVPVRYLGIADLPLFPFGLKPKPGSFPDSMIPLNQPDLTPSGGFSFIFFDPLRALFPPPKVTPPTIVAGRKRNFYQAAGNGAKLTRPGRNPRGFQPWWWASNMGNSEIHGELDDVTWENVLLDVPLVANTADSAYHQQGDDRGVVKMSEDISGVLASAFDQP